MLNHLPRSSSGTARPNQVTNSFLVWGVAPAIFCILVIWYPFGFSLGGMIEEWDFLRILAANPDSWSNFPGQIMSSMFAARPLQLTVFHVGRAIDPHSFAGFHILLMGSCFLRVVAGAHIGFYLFRSRAYAAAVGMLFLVYPADTQQISPRTVSISLAWTLMVCGGSLTLKALGAGRLRWRIVAICAAVVASTTAVLIYEAVITLYLLAPLLMIARFGFGRSIRILRGRAGIAFAWALGPLINLAYLFYSLVIYKSGYQAGLIHGSPLGYIAENLKYLLRSGAYRTFFDAWWSSWLILTTQVSDPRFIAIAALGTSGLILALASREQTGRSRVYLGRCCLVGLAVATLAYVPFVTSRHHMLINQRTFIGVAPGAAVVVVAVVMLLFRRAPRIGAAAASVPVFLGLIAQLYQHDQYARLYTGVIRPYMAFVADRVDLTKPVHLVRDTSGLGGYMNGMYITKIADGPAVRLGDTRGDYFLCIDEVLTVHKLFYRCERNDVEWTLRDVHGTELRFPTADVDVIDVGKDFDGTYTARGGTWKDLGSYSTASSIFNADLVKDSYRCQADWEWGYSRFCRGEGLSNGAPWLHGFEHQDYFVALDPRATLLFQLQPSPEDYTLRVELLQGIPPRMLSALKLAVNGRPVAFTSSVQSIDATVPADLLTAGLNEIAFRNAATDHLAAGLLVTDVALAPQSRLPRAAAGEGVAEVTVDRWVAANGDSGYAMLATGFSSPEAHGVWTDGEFATIRFRLASGQKIASFVAEAIPFLTDHHPRFAVDIAVNGRPALQRVFADSASRQSITVPVDMTDVKADGLVEIAIRINSPGRPLQDDNRDLGLYLERFKVQ